MLPILNGFFVLLKQNVLQLFFLNMLMSFWPIVFDPLLCVLMLHIIQRVSSLRPSDAQKRQ